MSVWSLSILCPYVQARALVNNCEDLLLHSCRLLLPLCTSEMRKDLDIVKTLALHPNTKGCLPPASSDPNSQPKCTIDISKRAASLTAGGMLIWRSTGTWSMILTVSTTLSTQLWTRKKLPASLCGMIISILHLLSTSHRRRQPRQGSCSRFHDFVFKS